MIFSFILMEIFFGVLRARAVGGKRSVSSNLNRSKFENRLEPCSSRAHRIGGQGEI